MSVWVASVAGFVVAWALALLVVAFRASRVRCQYAGCKALANDERGDGSVRLCGEHWPKIRGIQRAPESVDTSREAKDTSREAKDTKDFWEAQGFGRE